MQITAGKQNFLLVGSHKEEQFDFGDDLLWLIKVSSNKKRGARCFSTAVIVIVFHAVKEINWTVAFAR